MVVQNQEGGIFKMEKTNFRQLFEVDLNNRELSKLKTKMREAGIEEMTEEEFINFESNLDERQQ